MKFALSIGLLAVAMSARVGAFAGDKVPPLFDNGRTDWKVVVAENAPPCIQYAAVEFTNAVAHVSGVAIPVVSSEAGVKHAVKIYAENDEWAKERVVYRLNGGNLLFTGNQPRAALHATYAFLDRELGVRWLWPGEDGTFYTAQKKWDFPNGFGFDYTPGIWFRGFHHCGAHRGRADFLAWEARNYVNIHRHGNWRHELKFGHYGMPSMHNANLDGEKGLFEEHPECFTLISGHRAKINVCFSSELGAKKVAGRIARDIKAYEDRAPVDIISIFPNDNMAYCECESCKAMDVSTAWFRYYNKIVKELKKTYPTMRFATIAYQGYHDVPRCEIENTEFVEYASHPRCNIHKWDDPECPSNVKELKRIKDWCARKDVKVGHYAYEYDAISVHPVCMPFFSLVGDAVEKAAELGLVTQIPEVSLSPRAGPDIEAHAIQNRLTILYYARKMWQPELTLEEFLDDLCAHAYGKAARAMKKYFLIMDRAWSSIPGRIGLFVDGVDVSASLLEREKVREASADLLERAAALAKDDLRSLSNVQREQALYRQWSDYRDLRLGCAVSFKLARVENGERRPKAASSQLVLKAKGGKDGKIKVDGYWTPKAEVVFIFSGAKEGEVVLTDLHGERYAFAARGGVKAQKRITDVGIEETTWRPDWSVVSKSGVMTFRIPIAAFAHEPLANDAWNVRFSAGSEAFPVRPDMTMKIDFLNAPAVDRPIVYFTEHANAMAAMPTLRAAAVADGWTLIPCTNSAEYAASVGKAADYMIHLPDSKGKSFTPETAAVVRESVKNGGTLIVRSFWDIPLAAIMGDETLSCKCKKPKDFNVFERQAKWVREGDWCKKPWDFEWRLRNWFAPCYMQVPDSPQGAWVDYASMPSRDDESKMIPFLTAMKYGDGVIILVGETLQISHFQIIDNIRRDLGVGEKKTK